MGTPRRLWNLLRRRKLERDIADELALHLALRIEANEHAGIEPAMAKRNAERRLGSDLALRERTRAADVMLWLEAWLRDGALALRMLRRRPALTAVAVVTLAVGIGATTAMFSVVQRVVLQPLPFPQPRQLMLIHESSANVRLMQVAWPDYLDWTRQAHGFSSLAAYQPSQTASYRTPAGEEATLRYAYVTGSLFATLGLHFTLGHGFTPAEERPDAPPVLVVSQQFWRSRMGADPNSIGKPLLLDGSNITVVGVLAGNPDAMPWSAAVYTPLAVESGNTGWANRGNHPGIVVVGRLKDGVTQAAAAADIALVMKRLAAAYPSTNLGETATLQPFDLALKGSYRAELWLLLGMVGLVLLLACADLAHLLLAQSSGRVREFGVRNALGASRADLVRQCGCETLLLALLGGLAGLALAWLAIPLLVHWAPYPVPRMGQAGVNGAVAAFAAAAALAAALLIGLAPAVAASRANLRERMQSSQAGRLHGVLLVTEVALAVVVVAGASLLGRSLQRVLAVNPGFNPQELITLGVVHTPNGADTAFESALTRVRALPGVAAAGAVVAAPLHGTLWGTQYLAGGQPALPSAERPWATLNMSLPGYFQTVQAQLRAGRFLDASDHAHAPLVAVINEAMAERMGGNAMGKRLFIQDDDQWRTVVGVIANLRQISLTTPARPEIFLPFSQFPGVNEISIVVRAAGNPAVVARELAATIPAPQPPELMTATLGSTLVRRDFLATLMAGFGLLALLLAGLGIYGITAHGVAGRARELGVRVALGATPGGLVRAVLIGSLKVTALGLAAGLAGVYMAGQYWGSLLFGVGRADPLALAGTCVILLAVAVAACLSPAWRAAHADPLPALRSE
ncbi:MAG: ADOP family duplicated permease [Terriglobales bacterium]